MRQRRWFQFLASLGFEFWLPLPLLGLAFWALAGLVTSRQLSQDNQAVSELQITQNSQPNQARIFSIKVIVDRDRHISQVKVKQTKNIFLEAEFSLPTTEFEAIETAISKKLDLLPQQVKGLVRYQIEN